MLLNSFGVFKLLWEKNLTSFERFAPEEIVKVFEERISSYNSKKIDLKNS